jgi:hypothetical protein
MTMLSNPRFAVFGLAMPVLLAGGIACFLLGPFFGIAATGIAAFLDWNAFKMLRRLMRTTVTVDKDGARLDLPGDETRDIPWTDVRMAGLATAAGRRGRGARHLFIVDRKMDRPIFVTPEFARFDELAAAVRERVPAFHDITIDTDETLRQRLLRLALQQVSVDDDGIRFDLAGGETLFIRWGEVRVAGLAKEQADRGRWTRRLFVCQDLGDRWMVVPEKFERFDQLVDAVRERTPDVFHDITLEPGGKLKEKLQPFLGEPSAVDAAGPKDGAGQDEPADPAILN